MPTVVQWDPTKAAENLKRHGIDFADAATALTDDRAITVPDDHQSEERFASVAMDALGRVLVVIYTWRGDDVRLISARKATRSERRSYERPR